MDFEQFEKTIRSEGYRITDRSQYTIKGMWYVSFSIMNREKTKKFICDDTDSSRVFRELVLKIEEAKSKSKSKSKEDKVESKSTQFTVLKRNRIMNFELFEETIWN